MTATGHAIIGTVIAAKIANPVLAIPLALISHVIADVIPHWDAGTREESESRKYIMHKAFIDVVISFIVPYIFIQTLFPQTNIYYTYIMVLVSQSFDWFTAPYYFFDIKLFKPFYTFQKMIDHKLDKPWGIINQIAILILLIVLAKIF